MSYDSVAFSMATPFRKGFLNRQYLRTAMRLAKWFRDFGPLARIDSLHFAAFSEIDSLVDRHGKRRKLPFRYLLFISLFDGSPDIYLGDFGSLLADEIDLIWSKCIRYPGARGLAKFTKWIDSHALADTEKDGTPVDTYVYSGYPVDDEDGTDPVEPSISDRTMPLMPTVQSSIDLHRRLKDLYALYRSRKPEVDNRLIAAMFTEIANEANHTLELTIPVKTK